MKAPWSFFLGVAFSLAACDSPPQNNAAATRAEAIEASMDPEAARMVAAADSVRAAGERTADSLQTLKAKPHLRRVVPHAPGKSKLNKKVVTK